MKEEMVINIICIGGFAYSVLLIHFAMNRFFDTVYKNAGRQKRPLKKTGPVRKLIRRGKEQYGRRQENRKDHTDLPVLLTQQCKGDPGSTKTEFFRMPSESHLCKTSGLRGRH